MEILINHLTEGKKADEYQTHNADDYKIIKSLHLLSLPNYCFYDFFFNVFFEFKK